MTAEGQGNRIVMDWSLVYLHEGKPPSPISIALRALFDWLLEGAGQVWSRLIFVLHAFDLTRYRQACLQTVDNWRPWYSDGRSKESKMLAGSCRELRTRFSRCVSPPCQAGLISCKPRGQKAIQSCSQPGRRYGTRHVGWPFGPRSQRKNP